MLPGWLYREFDDPIAIMLSFVKTNSQSICYLVHYIHVIWTCYIYAIWLCYIHDSWLCYRLLLPNVIAYVHYPRIRLKWICSRPSYVLVAFYRYFCP